MLLRRTMILPHFLRLAEGAGELEDGLLVNTGFHGFLLEEERESVAWRAALDPSGSRFALPRGRVGFHLLQAPRSRRPQRGRMAEQAGKQLCQRRPCGTWLNECAAGQMIGSESCAR